MENSDPSVIYFGYLLFMPCRRLSKIGFIPHQLLSCKEEYLSLKPNLWERVFASKFTQKNNFSIG